MAMAFPDLQRVTTMKMEIEERSREVQPAMALGCGSPSSGGRRRQAMKKRQTKCDASDDLKPCQILLFH